MNSRRHLRSRDCGRGRGPVYVSGCWAMPGVGAQDSTAALSSRGRRRAVFVSLP